LQDTAQQLGEKGEDAQQKSLEMAAFIKRG